MQITVTAGYRPAHGTARPGTWDMDAAQLTRGWAEHYGYQGRTGGWIYRPDGTHVCHGWADLQDILVRRRLVIEGIGVIYRAADLHPQLMP